MGPRAQRPPRRCRSEYPPRMDPPPAATSPDSSSDASEDEALLEILGLSSLDALAGGDADDADADADADDAGPPPGGGIPRRSASEVEATVRAYGLPEIYMHDQAVIFPGELAVPPGTMRRLADEVIWGGGTQQQPSANPGGSAGGGDRTYETVTRIRRRCCLSLGAEEEEEKEEAASSQPPPGEEGGAVIEERRVLTRLENFVPGHGGWEELCHGYLAHLISAVCGEPMVLFKEKLNLKPPGGSGFAPHLDSPSLRVALGGDGGGPREFVTVMVAIDDMTVRNGCLRLARGPSSERCHVRVRQPRGDDPDGDGRAGAILDEEDASIEYEDVVVRGGTVAAFGGWVPHRSGANLSPFPRRAVFLTYNPAREGSHRERYYRRMQSLRDEWRAKTGLAGREGTGARGGMSEDERNELEALASIPRI